MAMNRITTGDNTTRSLRPQPTRVYQEAALNLRYKRITAITASKLQRAMALLQLEPCHLIERGLASESLLEQDSNEPEKEQEHSSSSSVDHSSNVEAFCTSQDLNGTAGNEHGNDNQNGQDGGWDEYEDGYDSDSDIEDDEDQDDEIEGRRKGPIYAFLVYGGVQLRPDEYVLLFRALGVSPQYIEQLNNSNIESSLKDLKAPS